MKNLDPKITLPVLIVIIAVAVFLILRSAGVGRDVKPPPIATGGPGGAGAPTGPGGQLTLPPPPGGGNYPMSPGAAPGGGMTLPTPGNPGGGTALPTPGGAPPAPPGPATR